MSFPHLSNVTGSINVNSTSNESNCPSIENRTFGTVKGQLVCTKSISGNDGGDSSLATGGITGTGIIALMFDLG